MKNEKNQGNKKYHLRAIIQTFYPLVGGMEMSVFNLYKEFVGRGWTVRVETIRHEQSHLTHENVEGVVVHRSHSTRFGYWPPSLSAGLGTVGTVVMHDLRLNPGLFILIFATLLKVFKLKKARLVLFAHGSWGVASLKHPKNLKFWMINFIEQNIAVPLINVSVDGIRSVSHAEAQKLKKSGITESLIHVVPNAIDPNTPLVPVGDREVASDIATLVGQYPRFIVSLGNLQEIKNIHGIIKSLGLLSPELHYFVVGGSQFGKAEYPKLLRTLAVESGVANRVHFLGEITGLSKFYLLQCCTAFVQPSFSEAFGNSVLEAMSQGAIPVVSQGTGMEELVTNGSNGFTINPYDSNSIAKGIEDAQQKMGTNWHRQAATHNREFAQRRNIQTVAEEIVKVLELKQ